LDSEVFQIMSVLQEIRELLRKRLLQLLTLAALMAGLGGYCFTLKYCVLDLDLWWHLGVGNWILQHHCVPRTGILSHTAASRPWVAYSWGYEVLLSLTYRWFGLLGVGLLGVLLTLLVAGCVYWMLHRLSGRFWVATPLAVVTCWAFLFSLMPRPVFFSMVLFMVTLTLILEAQRSGRVQTLYWLPLIFALWANVHIQFIYGLFLLGLFVAVNLLQRLADRLAVTPTFVLRPSLALKPLAAIFAICLLATCIGPYSFHLYQVIFEYSKSKLPYEMIRELQPLNFRFGAHYAQLLLAAAGFFAVGYQKRLDPFKLALLIIASVVAFRTMRDSWFLCIPAAACIADFPVEDARRDPAETPVELAGLAAVVFVLLLLFAHNTDFNTRGLDAAISSQFPVRAVNFLRQNPPPGPLYNDLNFGGFLIWYMPDYPVAIDGRNDLYGDELDHRFFSSANGNKSYASDPYLNQAGVVLLGKDVPLVNLLKIDPRFTIIYEDRIAAVFVRR
jgi:hypothetical protein